MTDLGLPDGFLSQPVSQWQWTGTTIVMGIMVLGRVWKAWKNGGGLRGIWGSFLCGTNTPKPMEQPEEKKP